MPAKKQTTTKKIAPQHEHILMPAKLNPYYLCCVRKGCRYTEYRPQHVGASRRRVLSQYEERHNVPRRREPAIIVEPVSLWRWEETPSEASESQSQQEVAR